MTETPAQTSHLMDIILSVLTPLLTTGAFSNPDLARRAALQTIAAYNARTEDELVAAAQVVTFALTALDNVRLSMDAGLSLTMKLKLRSSANTLNRSALNSTQELRKIRRPGPAPVARPAKPAASAPQPPTAQSPAPKPTAATQPRHVMPQAAKPTPVSAPCGQTNRLHWAAAMKQEAANLRSSGANVTPAQREANALWASVLAEVAEELAQPAATNPAASRAEQLRATLMSSGQAFPSHLSTRSAIRK